MSETDSHRPEGVSGIASQRKSPYPRHDLNVQGACGRSIDARLKPTDNTHLSSLLNGCEDASEPGEFGTPRNTCIHGCFTQVGVRFKRVHSENPPGMRSAQLGCCLVPARSNQAMRRRRLSLPARTTHGRGDHVSIWRRSAPPSATRQLLARGARPPTPASTLLTPLESHAPALSQSSKACMYAGSN